MLKKETISHQQLLMKSTNHTALQHAGFGGKKSKIKPAHNKTRMIPTKRHTWREKKGRSAPDVSVWSTMFRVVC